MNKKSKSRYTKPWSILTDDELNLYVKYRQKISGESLNAVVRNSVKGLPLPSNVKSFEEWQKERMEEGQ